MTHQTGIVESGVRRVKSITAPGVPQQKPTGYMLRDNAYGDPLAVEAELAGRFYKVELEPWLGWEDASQEPDGVIPHILEASKGKVVYSSTSGLKPFKPTTDTISVLVLPSVGEQLRVGMGLGGTWVQLLRCGDCVDGGVQQGKKGKGKNAGQRYWYMDDLLITLTSYHMV
ncbi:hypothetical protein L218DRAFT_858704 [Marasmius fiardii PR-910]|nr:hypothetical protein L218DRAFT_858704 [Marasmius fiardii PR-910]